MILRHYSRNHAPVFFKAGFAFMIVANLGNYFLHRGNAFPESVSDPAAGFLFGLSFGCFCVGAWLLRRTRLS